jgi:hypothetical protein
VKGGGWVKIYVTPEGDIFAKAKIKAGGDSADALAKVGKKKEPSPVEYFERLTGKKATTKLKDAANGRRLAKKKKKEKADDDGHSIAKAESPNDEGCSAAFWNTMWCERAPKHECWCRKTGDFTQTIVTDYMQTTVFPYAGNGVNHFIFTETMYNSSMIEPTTTLQPDYLVGNRRW